MSNMLLVLPLFTLGCGSDGFQPLAGTYQATITVTDDGCGVFAEMGLPEGHTEESEVEASFPEGGETVAIFSQICPLTGDSFHCEEHAESTDLSEVPGLDVQYDGVVSFLSAFQGAWIAEDRITGNYFWEITCEGSGCADAITDGVLSECLSVADFAMTLTE